MSSEPVRTERTRAIPTPLVLLCLDTCHGEFYLPLDWKETPRCPNDPSHSVAVYGSLIIQDYCQNCGVKLTLYSAGYDLCPECMKAASDA